VSYSQVDDDLNRVLFASNNNSDLRLQTAQPLSPERLVRGVEIAVERRLTAEQLSALADDLACFRLQQV
jgi:hypothetical protein